MCVPELSDVESFDQTPFRPAPHLSVPDRVFRSVSGGAALVSGAIVAITLFFLVKESLPALKASGVIHFFTNASWNISGNKLGVLGVLGGTLIVAVIALMLAAPVGIGMALFINEYAPSRIRRPIISVIDLLAALPSLLFGIWGAYALLGHLVPIEHWFAHHLTVLPWFRLSGTEQVAGRSSFDAGLVVGLMTLPIITSVTREVMAQVPRDQCEAAYALGGTRWGMIRSVIFPFSKSGIVQAVILAFGRALGETIAVIFLISFIFRYNPHVLSSGSSTIASMIVINFGSGGKVAQSGLIAAGLALFLVTLAVNLAARAVITRARRTQ
jgi:phosphate transport system permease protein